MRLSTKLFCVLAFLMAATAVFPQERKLGTWKMYFPYTSSSGVVDCGDRIFSAGAQSIFSCNKATGVIQTYDKSSGLNDVSVNSLNYDPTTKFLVIVYSNSNIDLIQNFTDVYNIPDIKEASTNGAISINSVSFYNGQAYLSTNQGISVIDLNKKEIVSTYVIGSNGQQVKVSGTTSDGINIYAATDEGVKYAPFLAPNLQDFNTWALFGPAQGLPTKAASFILAYNNRIYAVIPFGNSSDTLYQYNGTFWAPAFYTSPDHITSLSAVNGILYFSVWDTTYQGWLGKIDTSGNITYNPSQKHVRPLNWFESNGVSWESDYFNGLFKNNQGNIENIIPDGPFTSSVFHLDVSGGLVCVAPGSVDDTWTNGYNRAGFFIYSNNMWNNYNQYNVSQLTDNWVDFVCVANIPSKGKTYFGSFYAGLTEVDNTNRAIAQYDQYSGPPCLLEGAVGDPARTKISAMTSDANGNLWMSNTYATHPVKVLKADNTWTDFPIPVTGVVIRKMIIDQNNQLWASMRPQGVLVLSYGNDINNPTPVSKVLDASTGNGALPSADVYSLAEDKDGNIWVGTTQGIAVFYCPGSVLTSGGCDASQIKVSNNGYIGYLFGTENVRAIAVDAANRKWVGTINGVWLVSSDGKTQLLNFNKDNSPMPANQVTDIAIDDVTGEVYIGTVGGLVSYQGDAIGECVDCKDALVYPNPVKHDYTGPIAIKGLTDNAYVKITDATGTLVFQGTANGTQMIWDGNGYKGERAKSGVYFVFSSTSLGKEKKVAKILLMN